jgi:hypothetical protein
MLLIFKKKIVILCSGKFSTYKRKILCSSSFATELF